MNRYGLKSNDTSALIDQLTYNYSNTNHSNKLLNVADNVNDPNSTLGDFHYATTTKTATTVDYTYDVNGNMVSDANKKISSIIYNYLNLPGSITVTGKGTITYYYDAAGNKLQKKTVEGANTTVTTYLGSSVYQNDTLQFFGTAEGRVRPNAANTAFVYDYFLKDHLGNTRMVITDDYNVESPILEATSYYPFGLQQKGIGLTATGSLHNYKNTFQGQEFNEDLGVDIDEFKYRMDDPQIGRFWQQDPLSDSFRYNSVYAFSEDKVTSGRELEGLEVLFGITDALILSDNSVMARPVVETAVKTSTEVGSKVTETQDHHIIPQQFKGNQVVENARDGGFKFDGAENKIELERFSKTTSDGVHGNHPNYNKMVGERLAEFSEKNPNTTPEQAADFLRGLVKDLSSTINNSPGTKVNDLFKVVVPPAMQQDGTYRPPVIDPSKIVPKPPPPPPPKPLPKGEEII